MEASDMRIVVLGKTGSGKSSLCNTIFGEDVFETDHTANPGTTLCQKEMKTVDGRSISLIDTPGFFGPDRCEEELKSEIAKCIIECAPGPHAFLIVLKVEKFTEHENQVIAKIQECFSEEALKYVVVVFTHGDQLPEGMKIEEFFKDNTALCDLLEKCNHRCHVIDNKYWKNNQQDEYRNNKIQVAKLLNTIKVMVDNRGCYTNEALQEVERKIQQEMKHIRQSSPDMSEEAIREKAKSSVANILKTLGGITTGVLLGALCGVPMMIISVATALRVDIAAAVTVAAGAAEGAAATGVVFGVIARVAAVGGAIIGGIIGYHEAERADSAGEAVKNTAVAIREKCRKLLSKPQKETEEKDPLLLNK